MGISDKPTCGAHVFTTYWLEKWFNIIDPMTNACAIHDEAYLKHINTPGGTDKSSERIDKNFWNHMGELIKAEHSLFRKAVMYVQRPIYYGVVRFYGSLLWSYKAGD